MHIWVDADACPKVIKDILYRAVKRVQASMTLVANQPLRVPSSPLIDTLLANDSLDAADNEIVESVKPGDLVITADIPCAANAIEKGAFALDPRGTFHTKDSIRERLSIRNFMEELRRGGVETGGPPPLGKNDRQEFANSLDRFLAKHFNGKKR